MGYRTVKLRPLSSCPVQCRRPHHQPGCLKTWKPPRCRKTMRWKAVYHTLCFHMTLKPPCFWTRRSWDMARGVTYLFSSDKLKSRTLLLPPVRPRPPPGAPKPTLVGDQAHARWDGERTPPPARDHCRRRGRCRTVPAPKDSHRHYAHARSQAGGPPLTCA